MKKYLCSVLFGLICFAGSLFATNDLDKTLNNYYRTNNVQGKNIVIDDYGFVRRIYLDLAGRIPTTDELKAYITYQAPDKKIKLVDKLLFSEDYVNNFYNMFADMLRIRPDRLSDNTGQLRGYPYIQYVRDSLRSDKPYDSWVKEMLTAEGRFTQNPATSYLLRDNGMGLDNLATTTQLFIGKNIACAQCHDDPFQDYTQKQYYELFAFFGSQNNRLDVKDYRTIQQKIDDDIRAITHTDRVDNRVRQLLASNLFSISDNPKNETRLPHDYKYDDGKPNDRVIPVSLDRKVADIKTDKRQAFAKWLTTKPDFSYAIANRIWNNIIGHPLMVPMDNFDVSSTPEGIIIIYLGEFLKKNKYSLKTLIREIVLSDFYSRSAYIGDMAEYKFQSVLLKRISAYQLWDSILTLVLDDPNYTRINFQEYSRLVELDFTELSGKTMLDRVTALQQYDSDLNKSFLKYKGIDLSRACFLLNKGGFTGSFIKEFGSSDRTLIDSNNNQGSITQVLVLMNSPLSDLISSSASQLSRSYEKEHKNKDVLFLSIMGRLPSLTERSMISSMDISDLTWCLINTREFLFRK